MSTVTSDLRCKCGHKKGIRVINRRCQQCGKIRRHKQGVSKGAFRGLETDPIVDASMAEPARTHMFHDSRYWMVNVDEADRVAPVTVYDAKGKVLRVIAVAELLQRNIDEGAMYRDNFHLFTHKK